MKTIDLFYQVEGLAEIQHLEVTAEASFGDVAARLREKHGLDAEAVLFAEDGEEPLDDNAPVRDLAKAAGVKVHLHRCRQIEVAVTFNREAVDRRFAPGATVARVKQWAAVKKFGMTEEEAGEHVLQIAGTHDRPSPSTHIGALTNRKTCALAFDLVPDERINGAPDGSR
jgi:hypothetical protein